MTRFASEMSVAEGLRSLLSFSERHGLEIWRMHGDTGLQADLAAKHKRAWLRVNLSEGGCMLHIEGSATWAWASKALKEVVEDCEILEPLMEELHEIFPMDIPF